MRKKFDPAICPKCGALMTLLLTSYVCDDLCEMRMINKAKRKLRLRRRTTPSMIPPGWDPGIWTDDWDDEDTE